MNAQPDTWSYDLIADIYAEDMGHSMPHDDIGWYRDLCRRRGGRTLELGCGTGRILLPLLRDGADAIGIDLSLPMLRRLRRNAAVLDLTPRVARMSLQRLALRGPFTTVLAPYSLVTYLTAPGELHHFLAAARGLLEPDGVLVLDGFVPKAVQHHEEFRPDYRRPYAHGLLARDKRITVLDDGCHRIERRYRLHDDSGGLREEFTTCDRIRPYREPDLLAHAEAAGLTIRSTSYDYGVTTAPAGAQFYTLTLGRS
ncbi:class I SAM-dependent methyltransferase [Kitasatospora sp. NPDC087315]|uniref:class I SAM-dependent methyltransferase n=1 Tax=Kitasatospora sp. NPDC087315 TaxID=3364069 RepID=UPI0038265EA5